MAGVCKGECLGGGEGACAHVVLVLCKCIWNVTLHTPVLMYDSEAMLWKEKERSRIRAVQMDKGLLSIRSMDIVPNARIRELYGVKKRVNKRIDEGVLWWFVQVERMGNDRIAMRVCW